MVEKRPRYPPEGRLVSLTRSVTLTSLLGSAPVSPLALIVEVMAKIVTVPSKLCRPVILRQPPVAGLSEEGYPSTLYGTPMFNPFCRMYCRTQVPPIRLHFCRPAVACDWVSATFPLIGGDT